MNGPAMLTLAISTYGNRVSARLDCAETILLVTIEDGVVVSRASMNLLPHGKRQILERLGVNVLICGGLTPKCVNMLRGSNIRVIPWVQGDIEEVLAHFMQHDLTLIQ
jgi:predicted Fe-Mo cluster-binding NifX family protein